MWNMLKILKKALNEVTPETWTSYFKNIYQTLLENTAQEETVHKNETRPQPELRENEDVTEDAA